jgi:hypothetical protein
MLRRIKDAAQRRLFGDRQSIEADHAGRERLLQAMPAHAICAEIGVWEGDFSRRMLDRTRPAKLHLIDPWRYEQDVTYKDSLYGGQIGGSQAHLDGVYARVCKRFAPEIAAGEDTDLCFRLRHKGYTLLFEPRARITHCPPRNSVRHMWAHFYMFGATYLILQQRHGDMLGRSLRVELCQRFPWLAVILAPLLGLLDALTFYKNNPALRRYWYALPGVTLARLAWYIGLARGSDRHFVQDSVSVK